MPNLSPLPNLMAGLPWAWMLAGYLTVLAAGVAVHAVARKVHQLREVLGA